MATNIYFPQYFIDENQIEHLFINNIILVKNLKSVYGLLQAGQLSYIALIKHLQLHSYTRAGFTPGLFEHVTLYTMFFFVVDYFAVKYTTKNYSLHLIETLN